MLPGKDSDYDTDIEVEDVYQKLEHGIENIYEGTGRIMYEASCKTEGVVPISFIINRLTDRCISMRHHYMNEKEAVCLANGLKHNTMAEELDLVDNGIGIKGGRAFAEMAVKNKFLLRLNLAENKLNNEGVYPFYRSLDRHDNLQALILRNNGITRTGLKEFSKALKLNNGLQVLDLSENMLESQSTAHIFEALKQNISLLDLDLSWNRIQSDKLWRLLAKTLKANNTLEIFNMAKNGTGDAFFVRTVKQWKKQDGVKMLDVSENRLTIKAIKKLSIALCHNQSLEYLRLGGNQVGDEAIVWLLKKMLKKNATVKVLSLENIRITSEMFQTIAELQHDNDSFIIIYGTGHDISAHVVKLIEKLFKYMESYNLLPVDLYFQKPSQVIVSSTITKVKLDDSDRLVISSALYRLKLLNVNFNHEQMAKIFRYLDILPDNIDTLLQSKNSNNESDSEDETSEEMFSLSAWEPKIHRWVGQQFKLLTAKEIADFAWNLHRYILYLKVKIVPTCEQQDNLLDSRVLKLMTLKMLIEKIV